MNKLWVIEMLVSDKWETTVGCALNRKEADSERLKWKLDNPTREFRVARYEAVI